MDLDEDEKVHPLVLAKGVKNVMFEFGTEKERMVGFVGAIQHAAAPRPVHGRFLQGYQPIDLQ